MGFGRWGEASPEPGWVSTVGQHADYHMLGVAHRPDGDEVLLPLF
jgi:hypothetical protein